MTKEHRKSRSFKDEDDITKRASRIVKDITDLSQPIEDPAFYDVFVLLLPDLELEPATLLQLIEKRFNSASGDDAPKIAERICLLFGSWVRCCLNRDLMTEGPDGMLYPKLIELLDRMAKQSIRSQMAVNRVKLAILRAKPKFVESAETHQKKKKRRKRAVTSNTFAHELFDYPIESLADFITYTEARIFRRIHPRELVNAAWQKEDKQELAPHVVIMVDQFNTISFSIGYMICTCQDVKNRCRLISGFVSLAQALLEKNNFNGAKEVLTGLNSISVTRLKKTMASLDSKYAEQWDNLNEVLNAKKNSSQYRETLKAKLALGGKEPTIPFLGVHLKDLFFIDEGNTNFLEGRLNLEKIRMTANVLTLLQRCQDAVNQNYSSFKLDKDIQKQFQAFLAKPPDKSEDVLYELSIQLEPVST